MNNLISVIVSTYNWPTALDLVLQSLALQKDNHFEVIVADDGSKAETAELISRHQATFPHPLIHSWQEDKGFRLARSRNKAVTRAQGDYLIFMDGDCLVRKDFVTQHRRLAQEHCVAAGQRILLSKDFTQALFQQPQLNWMNHLSTVIKFSQQKKLNRFSPALSLPLNFLRLKRPTRWQLLRGCNWSLFKSDYLAVGGQDEVFEGWGYEDSDMAIRLINNGCRMKWGGFTSPCFHLWHKEADRTLSDTNLSRLRALQNSHQIQPDHPMSSKYENAEPTTSAAVPPPH